MEALTAIPFVLNPGELLKRVQIEEDSPDAAEFKLLIDQAAKIARPKALYHECFIAARGEDTVTIEGITFTSRTLRLNLDQVERVFAYVATCGRELDQVPLPPGDILAEFWWDNIKAAVLGAAREYLTAHLNRQFRLGKTATMNPGSGDTEVWPIQQQKELFRLLDGVTEQIGVELTDTFLMIPNKTVSGLRFQTEKDFRTCQVCHRESCPGRSAPFDRNLWEAIQP